MKEQTKKEKQQNMQSQVAQHLCLQGGQPPLLQEPSTKGDAKPWPCAHQSAPGRGAPAASSRSQRERSLVGHVAPLTWPFLDFLDHLDLKQSALVELGAGNSTLWFAERFGKVRSFETDPAFHGALAPRVPANVELELTATGALESADITYRNEEWMLVDFAGKRTSFLHHFLAKVRRAEGPSAIVLDNADWYRRGAAILREAGYLEIPFHGFKSGQLWLLHQPVHRS